MPGEAPKLIQPREHKAQVSMWGDLSVSDMDRIDESVTPEQIKQELSHIFNITDYQEDLKSGVLIDLYYYTIQFCRENNFTQAQTSALFSIVKKTHDICVETPFGNVQQCFRYFREAVLCHAVKRPPFSIDLFNADDVSKITDYVLNTYFRHLKMYKYVFTPLVRLDLSIKYNGMPQTPPPSEHGDECTAEDENLDNVENEEDQTEVEKLTSRTQTPKEEESPAARELRGLIRQHLSEELKKLKVSVDDQIKDSEEVMNKKLSQIEGSSTGRKSAGKSKRK